LGELTCIQTKHGPSGTKGGDMKTPKDSKKAILQTQWTVTLHPLAERELQTIPADMQARFLHIGEMLEELGPQRVGLPHIRPLESKLWEMRMTGRDGIARAVYAAVRGRTLLVLHVFVKKTQTTPRRAIETALKRLEEST
jgi:phage-related protein